MTAKKPARKLTKDEKSILNHPWCAKHDQYACKVCLAADLSLYATPDLELDSGGEAMKLEVKVAEIEVKLSVVENRGIDTTRVKDRVHEVARDVAQEVWRRQYLKEPPLRQSEVVMMFCRVSGVADMDVRVPEDAVTLREGELAVIEPAVVVKK